jgi:hypothetical protein
MEYFSGDTASQIAEIQKVKRIKYEKRGRVAKLHVGRTKQHLQESATLAIDCIYDPLLAVEGDAKTCKPPDPSHAYMKGVPIWTRLKARLSETYSCTASLKVSRSILTRSPTGLPAARQPGRVPHSYFYPGTVRRTGNRTFENCPISWAPTCPLGVSQATINADQKPIKKRSETDRPKPTPPKNPAASHSQASWMSVVRNRGFPALLLE